MPDRIPIFNPDGSDMEDMAEAAKKALAGAKSTFPEARKGLSDKDESDLFITLFMYLLEEASTIERQDFAIAMLLTFQDEVRNQTRKMMMRDTESALQAIMSCKLAGVRVLP